jgi:hypothetical protein
MQKIMPHAYNPPNVPPTISDAPWQARRVLIPGLLSAAVDVNISVADVINACCPKITAGTHAFNAEVRFLRIQSRIIVPTFNAANITDVTRLTPCDPRTGTPFTTQTQRATADDFGTLGFDFGATIASVPLASSATVVAKVNASSTTVDVLFRLISVA